jgi:hypothetical protein
MADGKEVEYSSSDDEGFAAAGAGGHSDSKSAGSSAALVKAGSALRMADAASGERNAERLREEQSARGDEVTLIFKLSDGRSASGTFGVGQDVIACKAWLQSELGVQMQQQVRIPSDTCCGSPIFAS